MVKQHRAFGMGSADEGHEVTYLHQHASERLLAWLWDVVRAGNRGVPTWGLAVHAESPQRLALRCLEAIDYYVRIVDGSPEEGAPSTQSLNWHDDGATLFTVAVALSTAGKDFEGGELEVGSPHGSLQRVHNLRRGDAVLWRGWDKHRVRPVRSGHRKVLVAEWWHGPSCSASEQRPEDSEVLVREALRLDGESAVLHESLGAFLYARGDLIGAAESYGAALQIDPEDAKALVNLGVIFQQSGDPEGAEKIYRSAVDLHPEEEAAHYNLASVLEGAGDLAGALTSLTLASRLAPQNAETHRSISHVLSKMQEEWPVGQGMELKEDADTQRDPAAGAVAS